MPLLLTGKQGRWSRTPKAHVHTVRYRLTACPDLRLARAVQCEEYFAPASGSSAWSPVATQHFVSHHRALQVVQRSCATTPKSSDASLQDMQVSAGPELGSEAARAALRDLCASVAPQLPVAAYGAASDAYRRWVEDNVRDLPEASQTAASAAGGS